MLELLQLNTSRRCLLVGEGNFSFTVALLKKLSSNSHVTHSIISTCYQKFKYISSEAKDNAKLANKLGAEIWFGVDATKIESHSRLGEMMFDYIIFNFPHVGGKMKIHLNRTLLKDFYKSGAILLKKGGKILVTLAKGQSGTVYDETFKRKTGDSWQVIIMATYGDLILNEVSRFNPSFYPEYRCNGFRGQEKAFHLDEALTFGFTKAPLTIDSIIQLPRPELRQEDFNSLHCPYIEAQLKKLTFKGAFAETTQFHNFFDTSSGIIRMCNTLISHCFCSLLFENEAERRSTVFKRLKLLLSDFNLGSAVVCFKCSSVKSSNPVKRVIILRASSSDSKVFSLLQLINSMCYTDRMQFSDLESGLHHCENLTEELLVASIQHEVGDRATSGEIVIALYIDTFLHLAQTYPSPSGLLQEFKFELSNRSLHPQTFCHHLSFWIPNSFSHESFACALRYAGGEIVKRFRLIEEYECPCSKRRSICYEVMYQSAFVALNSEKAFLFQSVVIVPFLERCLNLIVR